MTFDPQPTLTGPTLRVRPMCADDHDALFAVASDPELWAQHPAHDRWKPEVFDALFEAGLASGGGVTIETLDGTVVGSSRFYEIDEEGGSITVGYTFIDRAHWGDGTNAEVKRLMLGHVHASVPRAVLHVGARNLRSRRAVEKLGAVLVSEDADSVVYEVRRP